MKTNALSIGLMFTMALAGAARADGEVSGRLTADQVAQRAAATSYSVAAAREALAEASSRAAASSSRIAAKP